MPSYFLTTIMKQLWVALRSYSDSGLGSGDGIAVSVLMVGKIFLNSCFSCPFAIYGERGRFLEIRSSVSPFQVVRWTFL